MTNIVNLFPNIDQYSEYLIEYDDENNTVYISGLDSDDFWIELEVQEDVAEPESYAFGYLDALKLVGKMGSVQQVDWFE